MTTISLRDLQGDPRRMRTERIVRFLLRLAAMVSLLISALIVFSLLREAWTFMTKVEWATVWSTGWFPRRGLYDVKTIFAVTLLIAAVAVLVNSAMLALDQRLHRRM